MFRYTALKACIEYQVATSTTSVMIIFTRRRNDGLNQSNGSAKAKKHKRAKMVVDFLKYHGTVFGSSIVFPHD
jgi:hypothetical protein